jgi:thioredoxin 1
MAIIELDEKNFQSIITEKEKLVIDFWAPWCSPCKKLSPIIEELSNEIGEVSFAKVNVEAHPEIASKYQIFAVPTILFFKNGNMVDRVVGAQSKDALLKKIKETLSTR